jgi:hypothetical protein
MPSATSLTKPNYAIIFIGPPGSGKTRCGLSFPKVMAITFDPVGLEIIFDPANEKLKENLIWTVPMNGIPLDQVFKVTDEPSEDSLYGAIALAKKMKKEDKIETVLLDGTSYLADLKQEHVADDRDTRAMYRQLGGYLSQFFLQNFLPLAVRHGLNVIMTCHLQRESNEAVEGVQDSSRKEYGASKPLINQNSNLNAQIVGGFRHRISGMPSAVIYLSHRLEAATAKDVEAAKKNGQTLLEGAETLNYYAYCQKTYVKEWESEVDAKNRYGLSSRIKMTGGNFYKTLLSKLPKASEVNGNEQPTLRADAQPIAKGAK